MPMDLAALVGEVVADDGPLVKGQTDPPAAKAVGETTAPDSSPELRVSGGPARGGGAAGPAPTVSGPASPRQRRGAEKPSAAAAEKAATAPVPLTRVQVGIREDMHLRLKLLAVGADRTMSDLIRDGLAERREPCRDRSVVRAVPEGDFKALQVLVSKADHRQYKVEAAEASASLTDFIANVVHQLLELPK